MNQKGQKTRAVRLYGKGDLRLEEFTLPKPGEEEILARVISDSICMSSYKAQEQGAEHKRVPDNVAENPVIIGHEFCGELVRVGSRWAGQFREGDRFSIQPALNYRGSLDAPGYSFPYIGGDATYVVIPREVMEMGCLLPYSGEDFFMGSLSEPVSCIVGTFHAMFHVDQGQYVHRMGIREGGRMAILAGVGPMGLGSIDYALHGDRQPGLLVVTDIDDTRLARAASLFPPEEARRAGVDLRYINTRAMKDPAAELIALTGGEGFDDVLVMAPVEAVAEQGDRILGKDGCLNFFAGPSNPDFSVKMNFYNVHYSAHHVVGTSGGNTQDMIESLDLMSRGLLNPASMITHVGGLNAVVETTMNLPRIPGGKKLIYTHKNLPLTALADFGELGKTDPFYAELDRLVKAHNGLWNGEAERFLLAKAPEI